MSVSIPELVDAIHVALGLRLDAIVLAAPLSNGANDPVRLLVVAEDLPDGRDDRMDYLRRRTPLDTLDGAAVTIKTPAEVEADPPSIYRELAATGRVLLDTSGRISGRLAAVREDRDG